MPCGVGDGWIAVAHALTTVVVAVIVGVILDVVLIVVACWIGRRELVIVAIVIWIVWIDCWSLVIVAVLGVTVLVAINPLIA